MQNVLVFAGCRQSGKSTSSKFIHGYRMKEGGVIDWFDVNDNGNLLVEAVSQGLNKEIIKTRNAILDIHRQDWEFAQYADENIWPLVKNYSFATELKESAINIFGFKRENVYGTDEQKAEYSNIKWKNIWNLLDKERQKEIKEKYKDKVPANLTFREVLQDFGTICRVFDPDCWVNSCWNKIEREGYPYCIIDDCRYLNEILISNKKNANVVLFTAKKFDDNHSSEKVLEFDRKLFKFVIDNANMTLKQKNDELVKILYSIGWTKSVLQ